MTSLPDTTALRIQGVALGVVHSGWLERVLEPPSPFRLDDHGELQLTSPFETFSSRSAALADWADSARDRWGLPGWRDERVVIRDGSEPRFCVERALLRPLGLVLPSVQACAYCQSEAGPLLWIARRAAHKPVDPGCFDALVAGGIAGFDTAWSTLMRECQEEAGIPQALAQCAQASGSLDIRYALIDQGQQVTHREHILLHDLELPADLIPTPNDGEHQAIVAMSALQAWNSTLEDAWTPDGAQATRALIQRNRWLDLP
ncbi:MAG: hypothetical protein RLZ51_1312 [Pseudomonadota bacterium]